MNVYFIRNYNKNSVALYVQAENKEVATSIILEILRLDPTSRIMIGINYLKHINELFTPYKNIRCYLYDVDLDKHNTIIIPYYTREEKIDLLLR